MKNLFIDTSTENSLVVFAENESPLFIGDIPKGIGNSKLVAPEIEKGLAFLGITPQDLSYISVGIGPGSYTGIRVGMSLAQALAYATKTHLITICSLDGYNPSENGEFIAIVNANAGGAYYKTGLKKEGIVLWTSEVRVAQLHEINEFLHISKAVSPDATSLQTKAQNIPALQHVKWQNCTPDINSILYQLHEKFQKQDFSKGYTDNILYLKKTNAEINKKSGS